MESNVPMRDFKAPPYDVIGKPDPLSNLRPIKFSIPDRESSVERLFRIERTRVQDWNQRFWMKHNENFKKEKEKFYKGIEQNASKDTNQKSNEVSVFYKDFLDRNWQTHYNYNIEWYKKNIYLSFLEMRVHISRILRHCKLL